MAQFDISSFFNKSSGMSAFNYSDYSMIKSGGYKKLMKSYYNKADNTSVKADKTDKTDRTNKKTGVVDTTGLTPMKKQAASLQKTASDITKSDAFKANGGTYDTEKIAGAVNNFVKDYNSTIDQSDKITSKDVTQQVGFMKSMTKTMSKALSQVGITVGDDGKLNVNEETLKNADMKNVKSLFSGSYSYASQIADKASAIGSAVARSSSMYTNSGSSYSSVSSMYSDWI